MQWKMVQGAENFEKNRYHAPKCIRLKCERNKRKRNLIRNPAQTADAAYSDGYTFRSTRSVVGPMCTLSDDE